MDRFRDGIAWYAAITYAVTVNPHVAETATVAVFEMNDIEQFGKVDPEKKRYGKQVRAMSYPSTSNTAAHLQPSQMGCVMHQKRICFSSTPTMGILTLSSKRDSRMLQRKVLQDPLRTM